MRNFRITGVAPEHFIWLFGLDDQALKRAKARRYIVDETPGFPDRIEMRELEPGERALLVNFMHQPGSSPYQSSHGIYVREGARQRYDRINEVPDVMRRRPLSLRAFDKDDMMVDAALIDGRDVESVVDTLLANPAVAYIHAHNAARGCYSGRIDRV